MDLSFYVDNDPGNTFKDIVFWGIRRSDIRLMTSRSSAWSRIQMPCSYCCVWSKIIIPSRTWCWLEICSRLILMHWSILSVFIGRIVYQVQLFVSDSLRCKRQSSRNMTAEKVSDCASSMPLRLETIYWIKVCKNWIYSGLGLSRSLVSSIAKESESCCVFRMLFLSTIDRNSRCYPLHSSWVFKRC